MSRDEYVKIITESVCEAVKDIDEVEIDQLVDGEISYLIDSLVGIDIVLSLEEKLGVSLPDSFLSSENCSSINKIVDEYTNLLKRRGIYA